MTEQEERSHHKTRLQPTETLTNGPVWSTETKPFSPPWVKLNET